MALAAEIFLNAWVTLAVTDKTCNRTTCGAGNLGWATRLANRCREDAGKAGITPAELDRAAMTLSQRREDVVGLLLMTCAGRPWRNQG